MKAAEPYVAIGRDLLEFADGSKEPVVVEQDTWSRAYVIPERGGVPSIITNENNITIPTIGIASNPTIEKDDSPELLIRATERAYDSISRQEDMEIFKAISAAVQSDHCIDIDHIPYIEMAIWESVALLKEHDLEIKAIVMHSYMLEAIRAMHFKSLSYDILSGWLWGEEYRIFSSTMCPKNAIYALANPDTLGVFVVEKEASDQDMYESDMISEETKDKRREKGQIGRVVAERIGVCIRNDYALSRILISNNRLSFPKKTFEEPSAPFAKSISAAMGDESNLEKIDCETIDLKLDDDIDLSS